MDTIYSNYSTNQLQIVQLRYNFIISLCEVLFHRHCLGLVWLLLEKQISTWNVPRGDFNIWENSKFECVYRILNFVVRRFYLLGSYRKCSLLHWTLKLWIQNGRRLRNKELINHSSRPHHYQSINLIHC